MEPRSPRLSLTAGVLAAIGASVCCVGPLLLLALGVSGAWIGSLTSFEPYRPYFVVATLVFFVLAYLKLYRSPRVCAPGTDCADPIVLRRQRAVFWFLGALVLLLLAFPMIAPAIL